MSSCNFVTLRPLGTTWLCRLPNPGLRRYRNRWRFLAEMTSGDPAELLFGWRWLVQNKLTGRYMALGADHGTSALPQRKVLAALAVLREGVHDPAAPAPGCEED